jgi:hypothetical protein
MMGYLFNIFFRKKVDSTDLKVIDYETDLEIGEVLISSETMNCLTLENDDVVKIKFKNNEIYAFVASGNDMKDGEIAINNHLRLKGDFNIKDNVKVSKSNLDKAKEIVIEVSSNHTKGAEINKIRTQLEGTIVYEDEAIQLNDDDNVNTYAVHSDSLHHQNDSLDKHFHNKFKIKTMKPSNPAIVKKNTKVVVKQVIRDHTLPEFEEIADFKLLNIVNLPNQVRKYFQVKKLRDFLKVIDDKEPFIHKFENKEKVVYFNSKYTYIYNKLKKGK